MRSADVVVIGGSAAGIPAAVTARRHYPDKSILLIRREEKVLIPCGIPYIFGTVGSPEKNLIPDGVLEKNSIDLFVDEAKGLDPAKRVVTTAGGEEVGYDKLVLATGSEPLVPPIPGADLENVFVVKKEVPYLNQMLEVMKGVKDLVIIGGGFIGVEFADECKKGRDINVTVVEMLHHCLALAYDDDLCSQAEAILSEHGIDLMVDTKVEAIEGDGKVTGVRLADGKVLKADAVILGIGCKANTALAEAGGLEIGPTKGIKVDQHMRTSNEHIFACGDCAEKVSAFTGKPSPMKLASIASTEARIAGANLFSVHRENKGIIGVFATAFWNTTFGTAGLTQKEAEKNGFEVAIGSAEGPNRHPGGMPGMSPLKVKLVFNKNDGVLLGGQVAGADSGGELLNAISTFIQRKMTAEDIATFQLGTHPALTNSPIGYQLVNAAEIASMQMR